MKKLFTTLSGIALIMAAGSAYAAEEAKGTVKEINATQGWVVLTNGKQFKLAEGVSMGELKPGHDVTVSYETKGDNNVITGISKPEFYFLTE